MELKAKYDTLEKEKQVSDNKMKYYKYRFDDKCNLDTYVTEDYGKKIFFDRKENEFEIKLRTKNQEVVLLFYRVLLV